MTECYVFLSPADQYKILDIILSLKERCANTADGIKPWPLKAVPAGICMRASCACMQPSSFTSSVPRKKMKLPHVTAIHIGVPMNKQNIYRPISVLSVFSKIAEHVIN